MFLGRNNFNVIEVLISKALINSYNSHDESVSVNNALRGYNKIKGEIKYPEIFVKHST